MTESNKILTVSYGTFSCTLEGFDDPFGTMRGIAEYFRDLAAEDRYFGAEPPTPDVEMLQNIAQRDVQRRVDARIGESGVALRQADAVEDAELSEPAPTAEAPVHAAKEPDASPAKVNVPDTAPLAFDDEYLMADEPEDAFVVDTKATIDRAPAPESIAEKLRRIRAVVSRNIDPASEDTNLFSDAGPDEGSAFAAPQEKRERALSETIRSITADIGDDDDDDFDALNPADPDPRPEAEYDAELDDEDEATPLYAEDEAIDTDVANAGDAAALFGESSEDVADFEDNAEAEAAEDDSHANILAGVLAATAPADSDRDDEDAFEDDATDLDNVHRDEAEAVEDEAAETDDGLDAYAEIETDVAPTDEARTGDGIVDSDQNIADDAEDSDDNGPDKATKLEPLSDTNGAVGRLLKETDEKFAEDDGIRRRRVISQMRAAVAATKAERILSKPASPDQVAKEEQSPYRRDLDKVMPRDMSANSGDAPKSPAAATVQPTATPEIAKAPDDGVKPKAAPLVLVSSQRVDEGAGSLAMPSTPLSHGGSETETFAAFAEEMGAEELPDLLEAAAAFSAFVEGQPHFSRPDIMKRVARVDPALSLSREAGLRSFGMLLRQGKIRKLQRGQFTIADDTRFNPAHRIAGQ